jgi:protein involved in temperature-dependent protein secretion
MRNIEEGGEELKTSVQLNPNFATARQWYAQLLVITGPIEDAINWLEKVKQEN